MFGCLRVCRSYRGLGVLTWVYPPGLVDRVVAACGRVEQRRRLLLARLVMYFVLGLALFSPAPYLDVMRHLVEGLRSQGLSGEWRIAGKPSLFRARSGWDASRCGHCSSQRRSRWAPRTHLGCSGGGCGCWRWTVPAGT
ncbi:transposase domain-containing protein [Streptomyces chrestomyceticus]|uniref:transposase domain-containing protein n=1 Tax=Streptomyces chrestomyceticus TaxID=68185 RepID=UPI003557BBE2